MEQKEIVFQHNNHPREYVYELSNFYLLARSIHLAQHLQLDKQILKEDLNPANLSQLYPKHDAAGLTTLLKFLSAFQIFKITEQNNFNRTNLSDLSGLINFDSRKTEEWLKSYDILTYLTKNTSVMSVFKNDVEVTTKNNSLVLNYQQSQSVLQELSHLHLLSRAIHFTTSLGLFDLLNKEDDITIIKLVSFLEVQNQIKITDTLVGFRYVLSLLNRYQLLQLNEQQQTVRATVYTTYLQKNHTESMYPAMLVVTEKWWKAAAYLEKSFEENSLSAFEFSNEEIFYKALNSYRKIFDEGMAALSLLEDDDVATSTADSVQQFKNIIDIAGGKGGLLGALHSRLKHKAIKYVLFEKDTENETDNVILIDTIKQYLKEKYGSALKVDIQLGDFFKSNTIPQAHDSAYFIKCVLHNMKREQAVAILKNVRESLGDNCKLFLAERVVPNLVPTPHLNKTGNILMRMLFKANAYDSNYYEKILNEAGFDLKDVNLANNYMVFSAVEKTALRFSKRVPSKEQTQFWQQSVDDAGLSKEEKENKSEYQNATQLN